MPDRVTLSDGETIMLYANFKNMIIKGMMS